MNENMVTITLEEYTQLNRTAWKFELLRKEAKKDHYLSDLEKAMFELPEEKEETEDVDS